MRTQYRVTLSHATGAKPWHGDHVFTVSTYDMGPALAPLYYATAKHFGCGKNYRTRDAAINGLAGDSACRLISLRKLPQRESEFPDYDNAPLFDWLLANLEPLGCVDSSWRNDSAPSISFSRDDSRLSLHVDYKDESKREFQDDDAGATLTIYDDKFETILETESPRAALFAMKAHILADAFRREIKAAISDVERAAINAMNKTPKYSNGACATHDFCNANVYMLRAFDAAFGRPYHLENDTDLTDAAWNAARKEGF